MPLFRKQSAAMLPSLTPHDSKARLRVVTTRRDSWRSHVHCTHTAQRVQFFKLQTANVRCQGAAPLAFPWPPKRTQGALPLDPAIAGVQLEGLHALRNQVRCTWLRHESSASRYRYQPRLTIVRREWRFLGGRLRTECGVERCYTTCLCSYHPLPLCPSCRSAQ